MRRFVQGLLDASSSAVRTSGSGRSFFFTSLRLTTNVIDDNLPYEVRKEGTSRCTVETRMV